MKKFLAPIVLLLLATMTGSAQSACPEGTLKDVLGTSCTIGSLTFNFSSNFNGFKQRTDLATNQIITEFLDPSVVGFKPVVNGSQTGFQLIANYTADPAAQSSFFSSYNAQIFYTYQANGSAAVTTEIAKVDGSISGSDFANIYAFNSQCYAGSICTVEGPTINYVPGRGLFNDPVGSFVLGLPETNSIDGGNASIGGFAYTTSSATIISGTFLYDTIQVPPPDYTYSVIRYPGAEQTELLGVNNHGEIVGGASINGQWHAFLLSKGQFRLLDPNGILGQNQSFALAINDHGDIVGQVDTPDGARHGFLYLAGEVKILDDPSAAGYTVATGITESGEIAGTYIDQNGSFHAFIYEDENFTTPVLPGSDNGFNGVNARGEFVGWSFDLNDGEAISYKNGQAEIIPIPADGTPGSGMALSVNDRGDVVVTYYYGLSSVGAVLSKSGSQIVSIPQTLATYPIGINNRGWVVGAADNGDGVLYGFIATKAEQ